MIPERLTWLDSGTTRDLADQFTRAGHEIYLVGGSVRDALLGRPADDLDFTTDARPDRVRALLRDWADDLYLVGERFGTVGALREGTRYEITTFRAEVYPPDSRRPVVAFGHSIEEDLERRDFTVNAVALKLGEGGPALVDPFGGSGRPRSRDPPNPDRSGGLVLG